MKLLVHPNGYTEQVDALTENEIWALRKAGVHIIKFEPNHYRYEELIGLDTWSPLRVRPPAALPHQERDKPCTP